MKNKIKAWLRRINPIYKKQHIDTVLYDGDFELMGRYTLDNPTGGRDTFIYIGKNKFLLYHTQTNFHLYTIDEKKRDIKEKGKSRYWFYKRWFLHYKNQEFHLDVLTGWPSSYRFIIDWSSDYDLSISFWFGVKVYFGMGRLPKKFMEWFRNSLPQYEYSREVNISFHNGGVWWNLWTDSNSGGSHIPRWRNGNFNPIEFIKGRDKCSIEYIDFEISKLYFKEGGYDMVSIKSKRSWKYPRFGFLFDKQKIDFEAIAGKFYKVNSIDDIDTYRNVLIKTGEDSLRDKDRYDVNEVRKIDKETGMIKMKQGDDIHWSKIDKIIREHGIPVPGKGSASYNCGEDAIFSAGSSANNHSESFSNFHGSVMRSRDRYGSGHNWTPEKQKAA